MARPVDRAEAEGSNSPPVFQWPAHGRVIAGFGASPHGSRNDGINLALPEGTPVKAAADGVVTYAGNELKDYGNLVLVKHPNGYITAYAHAKELLVKRGDRIKGGQIIARSGQTGNVNAPQLHFELRRGTILLDPMQFLSKDDEQLNAERRQREAEQRQVSSSSGPEIRTSNDQKPLSLKLESSGATPLPETADEAGKGGANSLPAFQWPAQGRVIARFGASPDGSRNDGINLALPEGTPVKAAEDGVVAYAGNELKAYGNLILVRHPGGYVSAYAHAKELLAKRDDQVKRGQVIARSGQTGNVNEPQLHFEVRKGATPVDPMQFLTARVDCPVDLAAARAVAAALKVTIEAPQRLRVSEPIKVVWSRPETARPNVPLYLVLTAPPEVRFAGTGFMGLTPDAKGPHNLAHGAKAARALVAFYRQSDIATDGEISVLPYRRGAQSIGWAVVTAGSCGEQILARGEKTVEVAPGPPEIVVQDLFAITAPLKRLSSPAGTHELLVFKDRYEVLDVATGSRLIARAGIGANFSPTGRFVTARRPADERLEVVDLVSSKVVAETGRDGGLGWVRSDSYLIYAYSRAGSFVVWNIMADGKPLLEEGSYACMACVTLESVNLAFDLDGGFLAAAGDWNVSVTDLFTRAIEPKTDAEFDRLMKQSKYDEAREYQRGIAGFVEKDARGAVAYIRRTYDPSFTAFRDGDFGEWNFGEKVAFSNVPAHELEARQFKESHATILVHPKVSAVVRVAAAASKSKQLRGRTMSGRGFQVGGLATQGELRLGASYDRNAPNVVFERLANAGIPTQAPIALAQVPIDTRKRWEDNGEAAARQVRSIVPVSGLFREGLQCHFEDAPEDAVLVDPRSISALWRWHDSGADRLFLQVTCEQGAAGRFVMSELFVLQPSGAAKVTALLDEDEFIYDSSDKDVSLKIVRLAERAFAVVVGLRGKIAILDPIAGKRIGGHIPLVDASLLSELRLTTGGKHLVQLNSDGRFFVHRVADGKRVLVGAHVDDEIVVANDDGLYDTTYEGAQSVQVRFPGSSGLFRFNQFEAALRRTKLAAAVLAGTSVASPAGMAAPPTAELTLNTAATNGRRTGKVLATSERELSAVRLYVDGRLITQTDAKGMRAEVAVDLPDPGGGRWITAVAVDAQGLISQPSAVQLPGPSRPHGTMRAVVVGVDSYQDPGLPRLAFAKADAQRLLRTLKASERKMVQHVQTTALLDAQVTPERLLDTVREAARATGPDDMLVFFYAGHGLDGRAGGQADAGLVLTMPATRTKDLKSTAVSWAHLAEAMKEARGTIVVLLDACHAGIAGSDAFATNDDAVSALMTRAGAPMVVLAGSKGRQLSYENAQAGGGVFTAAIAAAISDARAAHDRDKSGLIDLGELYTAVKAKVFQATKGKQTPWLSRNALVGEMALF